MILDYQPPLVTRYIHNLLVIHFNVGESIAFAVNDVLRRYMNLGNYCVTRATQYTPHFHLYVGENYVFFPTARELRNHIHYGRVSYERCLGIKLAFDSVTISMWSSGNTDDFLCRQTNNIGETIYIIDIYALTRVTERQFCFEIDKIFEKFAQLCKNAE